MKYTIVYINPNDETDLVYFLYSADINKICAEDSDDLSNYITRDKSQAYLFDNFDDAKNAAYNVKYYHRELSMLKVGIQRIEEPNQITRETNEINSKLLSR